MKRAAFIALSMTVRTFASDLEWSQLPPLPDREGFAGAFSGVASGALVLAGGANIAGEKFGETFTKVWYDDIYVLEAGQSAWRKVGKLPKPNGYGVSISTRRGVLCIGGGDAKTHFRDCLLLQLSGAGVERISLPPLPSPCAMMCGAAVGDMIYIAGGLERPDSTAAMETFWSLDLAAPTPAWKELTPCPGGGRMLAVAAADEHAFYLFSGAKLSADPDGKAVREYLRDAWRYTEKEQWRRLPDLPRAAVAAPSPAPVAGGRIYIFSGDDGANTRFTPISEHPGFPQETLIYEPNSSGWTIEKGLPFSRATVPVVAWRGSFVIPNGEVRPRVRTPEVWQVRITSDPASR